VEKDLVPYYRLTKRTFSSAYECTENHKQAHYTYTRTLLN